MKQEKLADFTKLCASLGAKSCKAISDQSSDKSMHGDIGGIVDKDNKGSVSVDYHNNHKSLTQYSAEFPESNNRITDYNSLWINGEPSWKTMKDLRIQKGILKYEAKFSYTDDFGINAKFDAKVQKMGINVGFKFESIKKETVIINVEFNPIS